MTANSGLAHSPRTPTERTTLEREDADSDREGDVAEYSCFLHPRCKGNSLDDRCPACDLPYSFPLDAAPAAIGEYAVEGYLGRGFYSAVYKVRHPVTGGEFAMKVTPCQTYTDPDPGDATLGGFAGKTFEQEYATHTKLAKVAGVVDLLDVGVHLVVDFAGTRISCNWMRMSYVPGRPLSEVVERGPRSPREAAQIALDLLTLVDAMQQRGIHHNDLHGGNAVVEELDEAQARRAVIDPFVQLRVFDLGSAAEKSKSLHGEQERLNDLEHVAQHIIGMITAYERDYAPLEPRDMRLCAQLRRLALFYCGHDRVRLPAPRDMAAVIERLYNFAEQPSRQPLTLDYLSQHFNAQTLPSQLAPELLYDPEDTWARRLMGPGPQLVAGMRGCGKTILLRSLEWSAHARQRKGEADDRYRARAAEAPVGLFVSCASLLRKARASTVDAPLHRLFLAFAREALRALAAVDFDRIDAVRFGQLDEFADHVAGTVPWFVSPSNPRDLIALERAVEAALQRESLDAAATMSPHIAFERLAELIRSLAPMWASKTVLYLLDDVSTRFLPHGDVEDVLSQLCLKSDKFGFKISTESQTLALTTPGGALAREGRDYEIFDLGREVLANLGGARGVAFLEGVLRRRQEITPGAPTLSPKHILGCQPLQNIASEIHDTRSNKTPCYWGIQALAGMCVGDIGDVLQMYERMLARSGGSTVAPELQHEVAIDFSEQRLINLAGRSGWLYSHAVAFATASQRELVASDRGRLRQYTQVFVKIPPDRPHLFEKLVELVDAGVLIFVGGTPRHKLTTDAPALQFKLAFRKFLGLSNRMPLSMRDRFEPSEGDVEDWLLDPRSDRLQPRRRGAADVGSSGEGAVSEETEDPDVAFRDAEDDDDGGLRPPGDEEGPPPKPRAEAIQDELFAAVPEGAAQDLSTMTRDSTSTTLFRASCVQVSLVAEALPWAQATVVAALGFEDRSVGAWSALAPVTAAGAPRVELLRYPDPGREDEVRAVLAATGLTWNELPVGADAPETASQIVAATDGPLVIDTTSLTKPLIYALVREALISRRDAWVLHTCAADYEPRDDALQDAVSLLDNEQYLDGFAALNEAIRGEVGPFTVVPVGPLRRDPSQSSLLVVFVSLKHERMSALLDHVPSERTVAVASVHTAGERNLRSRAMRHVAAYLAAGQGGEEPEYVGTLDAQQTYELLARLHARHTLDDAYNFEIALTGTKMQAVGLAMMAATATPAAVYYSRPDHHDSSAFTHGTGPTVLYRVQISPVS